jgi:mono/diheme cytochrome c family protein
MRNIGARQTTLFGGAALMAAVSACNSFDDPGTVDPNEPRLMIPVDERPATTTTVKPVSISGGTLSVLADGSAAIVADPDRDRVSIVDLTTFAVRQTIALQAGDEPGRSVEDGSKRVHVALRGSGAIAVIDTVSGTLLERRAVCKAPRGLAYQPSTAQIHVACSEGKLVSLSAQDGSVARTLTLDTDLRDVLVRGTDLLVTRFKSAELLRIGSAGTLDKRSAIPRGTGLLSQPAKDSDNNLEAPTSKEVTVEPGTAWRAVGTSSGGAVIVHQQAVVDPIDITAPSTQGSAYGGGSFDCSGIVKSTVTAIAPDGTVVSSTIQGAPMPVDVAVSPDQQWIAIAHAGQADFEAPRPQLVFPSSDGSPGPVATGGGFAGGFSVTLMSQQTLNTGTRCAFSEGFVPVQEPVTAVAFTPSGKLLAQTRQPAQLYIVSDLQGGGQPTIVALPGDSRLDTGHELFHRDAGGGIACASCHPEGGEDGKTWRFSDTGERRTQALHVGLRDTAPFHWAGDLANVGELMSAVFVGRMGGVRESDERLGALQEWLFSLEAPPAIRDATDEAAVRGRALFNSESVGCATCHSGGKLTNNQTVAIDSVNKQQLQVPSLVAIGYRAPFMHTGCAATLAARFDPACGGNSHGNVAGLDQSQLSDLVAYLESL